MYQSIHTGAEIDAGIRPYKVYTALLTQSGTSAPVATVLENQLDVDLTWQRANAGDYELVASEAIFDNTKVFLILSSGFPTSSIPFEVLCQVKFSNTIEVCTASGSTNLADNLLKNSFFEIRVYP